MNERPGSRVVRSSPPVDFPVYGLDASWPGSRWLHGQRHVSQQGGGVERRVVYMKPSMHRGGDPAEVFRSHWAELVRLAAFILSDRGTGEDVVQDVFVRAHQRGYPDGRRPTALPAHRGGCCGVAQRADDGGPHRRTAEVLAGRMTCSAVR